MLNESDLKANIVHRLKQIKQQLQACETAGVNKELAFKIAGLREEAVVLAKLYQDLKKNETVQ